MLLDKIALKSLLNNVHGYIPIRKPKGVCATALSHSIICDLNWTLSRLGFSYSYISGCPVRFLEPFAEGLLTLSIGTGAVRKRNFGFSEYNYRCTVEFGIDRFNNTIDGHVLGHGPINHLNYDIIDDEAQLLVGKNIQPTPKLKLYEVTDNEISQDSMSSYNDRTLQEYYSKMKPFNYPFWRSEPEKRNQKYPLASQLREVHCDSIKLIDYIDSRARFDIKCTGFFVVRDFIKELANNLGTVGSVVEMTRYKEGPMHLDDLRVLEMHETILDYYIYRLGALKDFYSGYLKQFDDQFETKKVRHM